MKHLKLFENFREENSFSSEDSLLELKEEMSPVLRKSLDLIGKGFKSEEDIVKVIKDLGFETVPRKHRTSEYAFRDPKKPDNTYVTHNTGYVRVEMPVGWWTANRTKATKWVTPITKFMIPEKRDRLLMILRLALKAEGLYQAWKSEASKHSSFEEFLHSKRGSIAGKKYGL